MHRSYLTWGIIFIVISIIGGALGAHALKEVLSEAQLDSFKTGARFNMYGGFFLLFSALAYKQIPKIIIWPSRLFILGTLLFSFSIYLLNLRSILGLDGIEKILGPLTPIGGILLIVGWLILLVKWRLNNNS